MNQPKSIGNKSKNGYIGSHQTKKLLFIFQWNKLNEEISYLKNGEIWLNYASEKALISKTYTKIKQLDDSIANGQRIWPRYFPKEGTEMVNRFMKKYETWFIIKEMQIKITIYMGYVKKNITSVGEKVEKRKPLNTVQGNVN